MRKISPRGIIVKEGEGGAVQKLGIGVVWHRRNGRNIKRWEQPATQIMRKTYQETRKQRNGGDGVKSLVFQYERVGKQSQKLGTKRTTVKRKKQKSLPTRRSQKKINKYSQEVKRAA